MWLDWIHHALTSRGAADAFRPVLLNAAGVLDPSLLDVASGSFTPTLLFGGGNTGMVYTVQSGLYRRSGKLVNLVLRVAISAKGSSTGAATVDGLPFSVATIPAAIAWRVVGFTRANVTPVFLATGTSIGISYRATAAGAVGGATDADFAATTVLDLQGSYFTA